MLILKKLLFTIKRKLKSNILSIIVKNGFYCYNFNVYVKKKLRMKVGYLLTKKIDLNNPPKGGYVLIVSQDVKIGASGNFARELSLAKGLNKIQVNVVNSKDSAVRYIYITDPSKGRAELASINDARFSSTLKSLVK